MEVRVLGCYGNAVGRYRTTAFLLNGSVLLDAGAVTDALSRDEIRQIKSVIISHTHMDHVRGLFALIDEFVMLGHLSLELASVPRVLEIILENLFNDLIWPDLTAIPSETKALIRLHPLGVEKAEEIDGLSVTPVLVSHTVYAAGFVIKEGKRGFMYTADTGPTERFWERAREESGIEFIIADVSFPNRMERFARRSGHMTLSMLLEQMEKYGLADRRVFITHLKPIFLQEILAEVAALKRKNIKALRQGLVLNV